jgi:CheY-like chemotaxis protein
MSLLGRLEDLSLADIVQIVFLSRRTGVLEIIDESGRHTVLFRNGLVIDAQSPDHPDLITWLESSGVISTEAAEKARHLNAATPAAALVDTFEIGSDKLAEAIRTRMLETIAPLLESREGEFNFILSSDVSPPALDYDPDVLFKEGGLRPQEILGAENGDKLKPLRGLEESLKAGRALRRSSPPPAPALETIEAPLPPLEVPAIADELVEVERGAPSTDVAARNIILLERDPLIRVAAKRAFARKGFHVAQFTQIDNVWDAVIDLIRTNAFFVTFLEVMENSAAILQQLKRKNVRLPVAMIDDQADLRRRHNLLRMGADLYLTRPSPARMHPAGAEEELDLFADELVLFAERAFGQWEQLTGERADAGKLFYEEGTKQQIERAFTVLKQLINELSDPNDIREVGETILRFSAEYLDRVALFLVRDGEFAGVGAFGSSGTEEDLDGRIRNVSLPRQEDSILSAVAASGEPHRGKLRRTPGNIQLLERLGTLVPTEVVALPIMQGERAIGILYGDNAEHRVPIDSTAGLEIFLSQAGYALGKAIAAAERSDRG